MKALVYSDWDKMELQDVSKPEPKPGEALVRIEACGICGSELEAFRSRNPKRTPPLILGHEFCGTIEALNGCSLKYKNGQRVVGNSVISCGSCYPCRRGDTHLCTNRILPGMGGRPGAMAEYICYPAEFLVVCPDSMDPAVGALTEPLVNGVHIIGLAKEYKKPVMAVIGAGTIGLMTLQAGIALKDARVLVADLNEERLKVARELGAAMTVNPAKEDLVESCLDFSKADGLDLCVDAVGAEKTKEQSIAATHPGGTSVWIGLRNNEMPLSSYEITLPEKKVYGTYAGKSEEYEIAVNLLSEKRAVGGSWIKQYPIEKGVEAFRDALESEKNTAAKSGSENENIGIKYMLVHV